MSRQTPRASVIDELRRWASGTYAHEAAVELLARALSGHLAGEGWQWVARGDEGRVWLDADAITPQSTGALSGGEQRILAIVASLAGGAPVPLSEVLPGLDRENAELVVAAMAHATGHHDGATYELVGDRLVPHPAEPILPWPT